MSTVIGARTTWTDPLTGSRGVPHSPGEILTTAIAYWEDEIMRARSSRPRTPDGRAAKQATVSKSCERLARYTSERNALRFRKVNRVTLALATADLSAVMEVRT